MPEELRLAKVAFMLGRPSARKGRKFPDQKLSEDGRRRIIEGLRKRRISEKVIAHTAQLNKGKKGKDHPKWTENKKRPLYHAIRTLFQYKDWRKAIFLRDNFTCQMCQKRGGNIEADHNPVRFVDIIRGNQITSIESAIACKELWSAQGRTLCRPCHETTFR